MASWKRTTSVYVGLLFTVVMPDSSASILLLRVSCEIRHESSSVPMVETESESFLVERVRVLQQLLLVVLPVLVVGVFLTVVSGVMVIGVLWFLCSVIHCNMNCI